jgi:hypothetical protein|tara:strand:- start:3 stop:149 length:147 start_codon:yes stop_codon:yes gene_type:complete
LYEIGSLGKNNILKFAEVDCYQKKYLKSRVSEERQDGYFIWRNIHTSH